MRTYLLQRALAGLVTLIGVTILIFLAMRVLPGDPLAMMTSESDRIDSNPTSQKTCSRRGRRVS